MITDSLKALLLELYYEHGVLKKEIRSYEASLWTLQDDFLTVLKWSDVEQKGRIEHPKMTLNIDGTLKFSFSIPMYYREKGLLVENPNWYNTLNGNLMTSLRKVKVIFNKGTTEEGIFEFVIINVTESHERDILTCEVESEGLAFLELGKIGYKISLSLANFELVYKDWYENHHSEAEPLLTVDYWCGEAGLLPWPNNMSEVNPRAWYYDIRMNWNSFLGGNLRSPKKVYEEPYTTSWEKVDDIMIPKTEEEYREKARPVEIDKSNLYNITLTIAETFEIFCRYEFIYDENYHIIGRIIVFYNNFMNEDNMFTILYPYSASKISRKMDSTDTTTKLFILDPDNMTVESGQSSVMNAPPNASKEDYILNFDYMYQTEAITKELYDAIKPFEADMYDLNEILILYLLELASYLMKKPELEGKIAVAEKSMKVADELVKLNENKKYALAAKYGDGTDLIKITYKNPDYCIIRADDAGNKFITTAKANTGVNESTVNIYTTKNTKEAAALGINKVTDFKFEHDEYNNITRIVLLDESQLNKLTTINYSNVYSSLCSSIPATQKQHGAVDLKNRPIVSMLKIADAGYPIDNRFGYYSLCALVLTIPANNGPYSGCDIVYTPITVDGEVRSATEMRTYIDSVSIEAAKHSNTRDWATYDTLKMIIDVINGGTGSSLYLGDNGIEHLALRNWEKIKYHTGLLEILDLIYINGTKNTTNLELSVNLLIYLENHPTISGGDGLRRVTATIPVNGNITLSNVSSKIFDDLTQPDINLIMNSNNVIETPLTDMVPALYLTYGYNPKFYYDNIIKTWSVKLLMEREKLIKLLIELGPEDSELSEDFSFDLELIYETFTNTPYENDKNNSSKLSDTFEALYNQGLNGKIKTVEDAIKNKLEEKSQLIKKFEHMMGPALREGYWQPEHYDDYGDKKEIEIDLLLTEDIFTSTSALPDGVDIIAGWDSKLFDEEDTLYYKVGVLESLEYYPCIDLTAIYGNLIPRNLDLLSVVWWSNTITNTVNWSSIKDLGVMAVGSDALIKFIRTGSGVIKPVLMLVGAKTYSAPMLERLIVSGQARIELYDSDGPSHSQVTSIGNHWLCYRSTDSTHYPSSWEDNPSNELKNLWSQKYLYVADKDTVPIVYPRIKFKSLAVKTDSDNLRILFNDVLLEMIKHFIVLTRNTEYGQNNIVPEYYVTIKPDELIDAAIFSSTSITNTNKFKVNYVMSNANTAIYLDAIKVSKENAYPKASYEVSSNILNVDFVRTLYLKLAQIVMINDTDLKFENTFGYISGLELDLDNCQNDTMEVKNYKTKFEDLFSTIVAQTEAMKLSGAGLTTALSGGIPLSEEGLSETLDTLYDILDAYLDSYFDSSLVVKDRLADIFAEAAEILASSLKSLNSMAALTDRNAGELSKFVENIAAELTSEVFRQADRPASFKAGDIWIKMDGNTEAGRYLAIMSSDDLEDLSSETAGFVRTHDGSLANITGAAIDIDAEAGTIDIKAATLINLKSGLDIYIAANRNVDILGNKQVNIGGSEINLCTLEEMALNNDGTFSPTGFKQETTGINLIAGGYNELGNGTRSEIIIKPTLIKMGSADILMRGANKILLVTSRGTSDNTSAIEISPDTGVWIGSGQGVRIFSGGFKYNKATDTLTKTAATGASIELNSEHLILGYMEIHKNPNNANVSIGNVIEMTLNYMILASGSPLSGNSVDNNLSITGTSSGLVGAKFTKDSIGFATSYIENGATKYNAILMNGTNGITIGSGSVNVTLSDLDLRGENVTGGSYVRIASTGIELGSLADLYINTNNFKLQTGPYDAFGNAIPGASSNIGTRFAVGKDLQYITRENLPNGTIRTDDLSSVTGWVGLVFNDNGLYVRGTVYASAGSFTGDVVANTFIATASGIGKFKANASGLGFYNTSDSAIMTLSGSTMTVASGYDLSVGGDLTISSGKTLTMSGANINLTANSNKFIINSSTPKLYMADNATWSSATLGLSYDGNGLYIKGDIHATGFIIDSNASVDLTDFTGMTIKDWGANWNGVAQKYLMIQAGDKAPGGIVCGSTDGIARNFVIPWIPDPEHAPNGAHPRAGGVFTTPAFLINKDGLEYRYMTDRGDGEPNTPQSYVHINSNGVEIVGSSVSVHSGHITVNGDNVWERSDIIYSSVEPSVHPAHDWIWIRPNGNAKVIIVFKDGADGNYIPRNGTSIHSTTAILETENSHIVTGSGTVLYYTITAQFKLSGAGGDAYNYTVKLIPLDSNNNAGTAVEGQLRFELVYNQGLYTSSVTIPSETNVLHTNYTKLKVEIPYVREAFLPIGAKVEVTTSDNAVAEGTRVLCDVFYYP